MDSLPETKYFRNDAIHNYIAFLILTIIGFFLIILFSTLIILSILSLELPTFILILVFAIIVLFFILTLWRSFYVMLFTKRYFIEVSNDGITQRQGYIYKSIPWKEIEEIIFFYQDTEGVDIVSLYIKSTDEVISTTLNQRKSTQKAFKDLLHYFLDRFQKTNLITWQYREPQKYVDSGVDDWDLDF